MTDDSLMFDFEPHTEPDDADQSALPAGDPGLAAVVSWFRGQRNMQDRFASCLRQALDEVLDGQRTGRFDIDKVEKTEKTYLGTKVEIVIRAAFELPHGAKMDYRVAGHDIDSKFSLRASWSIPTEAMGHLCLLTAANDRAGTFDVGIIRIIPEILNPGKNKDQKTTITKAAKAGIIWLARSAPLPSNLLLSMPESVVAKIMASRSGQARINELFRQVQGRVIERNTAVTVAKQADGLKRCRDARRHLAPEGIVILGHQKEGPIIAKALSLPEVEKGTFYAVRLVGVAPDTADRPVARIGDRYYAVARPGDPVEQAPLIDG